ncbi:MAG: PspC domain-containing protein, partial [Bacteroidales bacterium]|nr:PspC domain-containing protein [Bacteroidales bacterium]
MKKVVKVSIGKMAFTVEEDGYLILKGYLEELNEHYRGMQNGNEIVEGIEERIADLFLEKSGTSSVISSAVVREVITLLGRPEVIDEESNETNYRRRVNSSFGRAEKRLYRDPDNKMIGGVCSGLAAYFNIDIAIVRVIFLVLLFFSWIPFALVPFAGIHGAGGSFIFIAYIIMWIAIPEARTVKQKFAMRGEKPDLSNIQRNIERSAHRVGRDLRRAGRN